MDTPLEGHWLALGSFKRQLRVTFFLAWFGLARKARLAQKAAPSFLSIRLAGVAKAYHVEFALARAALLNDICLRLLFLSAVQKHTTSASGFFWSMALRKKRYPSILSLVIKAHAWMLT